jgi:hypothetical protein
MQRKQSLKCDTKYCSNKRKPNRRFCSKCSRRREKETNPFGYFYDAQRQNARRRGKEFNLTKDEFKEFAIRERLMSPDGVKFPNKTIDRKVPEKGYEIGNIQVLTISENSRKKHVDYWREKNLTDEELEKMMAYEEKLKQDIEKRKEQENEQYDDLPF